MKRVGIERIGLYAGPAYMSVKDLFERRNLDLGRLKNIGLVKKSVALPCEDAVSYGVNAAKQIVDRLSDAERKRIELVITCTESPVDFGKSLSTYIHDWLKLDPNCRLLEAKQACYSGAAATQLAAAVVASGFSPGGKILVICTDVARATSRNTYAEPTQASGAVALLVSDRPQLLELDAGATGCHSYEVMDVCRPQANLETGSPDLSLLSYLDCLEHCFKAYAERVEDVDLRSTFDFFAFHTPFTGMVKGAHRRLMRRFVRAEPDEIEQDFARRFHPSFHYCVEIGNIYAGTVFAALCGVIAKTELDEASRVGLFSYGSGCSSEFFSGLIPKGARAQLEELELDGQLARRWRLDADDYERLLDSNDEWQFGLADKEVEIGPFSDIYEHYFEGRGLLTLKRISNYHREYAWS